jgi:hypothetical protein
VKVFSQIETTPDEIGKIARVILFRDKDKNALCLLLYLCNLFIQDWHREIIHKLNPSIVKEAALSNRKLVAVEVAPLTEFIKRRYYQPLAKNLENSLKKVLLRLGTDELHNMLGQERVTDIQRIGGSLSYFSTLATGLKNEWYEPFIQKKSLDVEAKVVDDWESELASLSERVTKIELRLRESLNCQENQMCELFRYCREHRRRRWFSLLLRE